MACRGSTDERSMRYLRFRIIADRAELSEASHACSRLTGFFGTEKTERLTRCSQEGRNGWVAYRYESEPCRSATKLAGIIEGTRAVMENKVRTPGGQIYTLPERWQIEPR